MALVSAASCRAFVRLTRVRRRFEGPPFEAMACHRSSQPPATKRPTHRVTGRRHNQHPLMPTQQAGEPRTRDADVGGRVVRRCGRSTRERGGAGLGKRGARTMGSVSQCSQRCKRWAMLDVGLPAFPRGEILFWNVMIK